jgi:membrane protease YdiL (CAAX protease family)
LFAVFAATLVVFCTLSTAPLTYELISSVVRGSRNPSFAELRMLRSASYLMPLYAVAIFSIFVMERRRWPRPGKLWLFVGGAIGAAAFLSTLAILIGLGSIRFVAVSAATPTLLVGISTAAAIIAFRALGEELFFRAWLQPLLAQRWGCVAGLAGTSLLFGLAHIVSRDLQPVGFINVSLAGTLFGLLALRTGGLAAPFGAHWVWNTFEQCVFGMTPNPGVDRMGSFINLDLIGPSILSGGANELNGSICTTVVLLASVAALSVLPNRHVE